jgi:hypothetical protein
MIWCELQQLMQTKCHKAGILALASTPRSKCMVRVWKVTNNLFTVATFAEMIDSFAVY